MLQLSLTPTGSLHNLTEYYLYLTMCTFGMLLVAAVGYYICIIIFVLVRTNDAWWHAIENAKRNLGYFVCVVCPGKLYFQNVSYVDFL